MARNKIQLVVGIFENANKEVYIEREELTILLRVVLLLLVRLYLIFGYITSQKAVKLPSMKVFCEMREGNLIGVDTNEAGHYYKMISRRPGTGLYIF